MKPDEIDTKILEALMEDGRASLRKIARTTSLTTPTVSARMARMTKAGLIKKFVPILSVDSSNRGVSALVNLGIDPKSAERTARDLAKLKEVQSVYLTTGQSMTLKVALYGVQELQSFLKRNVLGRPDAKVTSIQVITAVVKEEPASLVPKTLTIDLKCDYCREEVTLTRPYTIVAGSSRYYFCCRTCKRAYLDKYGSRLASIGRTEEPKLTLHS